MTNASAPMVLDFSCTDPTIGLTVRRPSGGPEQALVNGFAEWALNRYATGTRSVAIFREPAVETRFPDIVVAVFDPRRFEEWPKPRRTLDASHLRLVHHLHSVKRTDLASAGAALGLLEPQLLKRLEALHDAGLAYKHGRVWRPRALAKSYGVLRLIAVEAKVSGWRLVLGQADANRWFASESCVVTPSFRPSDEALAQSRHFGIGIYASRPGQTSEITTATRSASPASYASWLFNEWIGRRFE